ncbi:phasin family protein [Amorphus sp. MBR-141]
MTNGLEQFQAISKDNLDTAVKSIGVAQEGFQAIAVELADYSKKSFEDGTAALEKIMGAPSVEKAVETQMTYAKSAYEGMVHEVARIGELYAALAQGLYKTTDGVTAKMYAK